MTVEPSVVSPGKPSGLPIASLIASALATYFIIGVLPVESHADDWPGPGVGAAIGLQGAGVMAFLAMLLALIAWRPPNASGLSVLALFCAGAEYLAVGIVFPFVGLGPFCGQTASALAGVKASKPELDLHQFSTGCGVLMSAQYLVPLMVFSLVVVAKNKKTTAKA
ncbi:MAG: hypothetical protein JST54_06350 [Deltaproteobacteria bacterium]|nr:hypothetical protein [Deltaproteobacteria bacterium]